MSRLINIYEASLQNARDKKEASKDVADFITEGLDKGDIKPEEIRLAELFMATAGEQAGMRFEELRYIDDHKISEAIGYSEFPYVTRKLISSSIIPAYELANQGVTEFVTEGTTTKADYEFVAGFTAMGELPLVYPGQPYPESQFSEKNVRLRTAKWGEILSIEKELIIGDQTGELLSRARQGGDRMGQHLAKLVIQTITDQARTAFKESTSDALNYNGSAITVYHASTHATVDGQLNPNLVSSNALGTTTTMDAAFKLFGTMVDEEGNYISVTPRYLLVHPANQVTAWTLLNSAGNPTTGNRDSNYFSQVGMQVRVTPYLAATTDWFIGDPAKGARLNWYTRPTVDIQGSNSDAAFERDVVARFKYHYAVACGLTDYRFMVKNTA